MNSVIFDSSNTVAACEAQPHMPSSSLSAFFTVESPVKNTTGLPFSRFTGFVFRGTFCIMACSGLSCGFGLSHSPSAAERAFISAPNFEVWMWSPKKWYFSFHGL